MPIKSIFYGTLSRRTVAKMAVIAVAAGASLQTTAALAQAYPRRPVTIVVPFPPGAATDSFARAAGKLVALDPKPRHALAFHGLDLITPNKREALELSGLHPAPGTPFPAAAVCARLHEKFATKHLVITLGEDGMLLSTAGKVLKTIPTAAREVYDVSGAGDTALAALVLALAAGAKLETAAHFANAAAGVVVGKLGTATVTPAELKAYVSHR